MKLLLDTQIWLWMQAWPERFSSRAREMVDNQDNVLLLSPVSAWEIAIKYALQVATLPWHHHDPFDRLLIAQAQVERLPILSANRQLAAYDVQVQQAD